VPIRAGHFAGLPNLAGQPIGREVSPFLVKMPHEI
jgi:hypothetical protein